MSCTQDLSLDDPLNEYRADLMQRLPFRFIQVNPYALLMSPQKTTVLRNVLITHEYQMSWVLVFICLAKGRLRATRSPDPSHQFDGLLELSLRGIKFEEDDLQGHGQYIF